MAYLRSENEVKDPLQPVLVHVPARQQEFLLTQHTAFEYGQHPYCPLLFIQQVVPLGQF